MKGIEVSELLSGDTVATNPAMFTFDVTSLCVWRVLFNHSTSLFFKTTNTNFKNTFKSSGYKLVTSDTS